MMGDEIDRRGTTGEPSTELDQLAHKVIGAAIEVHRELGPGYHESIYEEAMAVELELRGIPFKRQLAMPVLYKGHPVGEGRMDMLVGDDLVVEYKTVESLLPVHLAQVLSYLKAARRRLGLLINFNVAVLKDGIKRIVRS
jgi:GxxExxY protein